MKLLASVAGALAVLFLGAEAATAAPYPAPPPVTCDVRPARGDAGRVVDLAGAHWQPGRRVSIRFDHTKLGAPRAMGPGRFALTTRIPRNAPLGYHIIRFRGHDAFADPDFCIQPFEVTRVPKHRKTGFDLPAPTSPAALTLWLLLGFLGLRTLTRIRRQRSLQ